MGKVILLSRKILATNTRYLRFQNGWSQEELAHRAETSATTISAIEKGKFNTGIDYVDSLAYAFNVDPDYMLHDHGFRVSKQTRIDSRTKK